MALEMSGTIISDTLIACVTYYLTYLLTYCSFVTAIVLCKLVNALPVMSITAGIYTMVIISIERLRCVVPPSGHDVPCPNTRSIGTACSCRLHNFSVLLLFAVVFTKSMKSISYASVRVIFLTAACQRICVY